jgi:hypothetical protein
MVFTTANFEHWYADIPTSIGGGRTNEPLMIAIADALVGFAVGKNAFAHMSTDLTLTFHGIRITDRIGDAMMKDLTSYAFQYSPMSAFATGASDEKYPTLRLKLPYIILEHFGL